MTGYGQDGPLGKVAGHDINYIAVAGVLGASARAGERPHFALNLVGDHGGGAMLLAFGIVCGVLEARSSGRGQVIDAAMVDGAALLTTLLHGMRADGRCSNDPGTNLLDSGAHFYEVYETSDGGHVAARRARPVRPATTRTRRWRRAGSGSTSAGAAGKRSAQAPPRLTVNENAPTTSPRSCRRPE
jgi:alpha-methylacyl-CoA racemase